MLKESLIEIYESDIDKVMDEIRLYKNEEDLWIIKGNISNSAGNLCLHLIGNLNHFFGAILGKTGFVRQRELEFSQKNIPRDLMLKDFVAAKQIVGMVLRKLSNEDLAALYPLPYHEKNVTTDFMLLHLLGHLSYHLGQINYHRRLC